MKQALHSNSLQGYDMEDAMIINKSAQERGLFDSCIYKTYVWFD